MDKTSSADRLRIDFAGLKLKTPFIIGSGQQTTSVADLGRFASRIGENRWAAVVTKTIISRVGQMRKPHLWSCDKYRFLAMQNAGPPFSIFSPETIAHLRASVKACNDAGVKLIASIIGQSLDEWGEMARACQDAGANALELNLSCPSETHQVRSSLGGYLVGQSAELSGRAVASVRKSVSIPVVAKLTFHAPDIISVAKACKDAGADGVTAINTIQGVVGVDLDTGIPLSSDFRGHGYRSGMSGPIIKPFGLRAVSQIAANLDMPICAMGGVDSWESAAEYIMMGASAVQVCTGVMWYGFRLGRKLASGLSNYMEDKGYSAINDFRGIALRHLTTEVFHQPQVVAIIDQDKCDMCGRCFTACNDAAFEAISKLDSRYLIEVEKCSGCGLCRVVCDEGAIRFKLK